MNTPEQTTTQTQIQNHAASAPSERPHAPALDVPLPDQNPNHQPPTMNHRPCLVVAEPVPVPDPSTSGLHALLNHGSYRVKEERALIQRRTVEPASQLSTRDSQLGSLESQPVTFNLQPSPPQPAAPGSCACVISAPPTATACLAQRARNGKIARLPKLERDLVNKLLHNHVPYSKIVFALGEREITVTERNISNWRTRGGYKEWCAEQENQLRLAHLQDHLTDYLRQHDAQQLPEVGLQVAATQLTSLLMNPQTAAQLLACPDKYAKIIDSLDKCSVRLNELQKDRYDTVRRAAIRDSIPNLRHEEEKDVECLRHLASAEKLGASAREPNIPHRNDLPPREEMPYRQPGPTLGDLFGDQLRALIGKPKQLPNPPSNDPQPAVPGSRSVTE